MLKLYALVVFTGVLGGCAVRPPVWQGAVEWPDEKTAQLVAPSVEAGTALAAAAAIREMVRRNPHPDLFSGCSSPEQGLNVAVFTYPKTGLYYVVVHQRFDRCGGPRVRVLDGWYAYAVTPQGEVVAEGPLMMGEAPPLSSPDKPLVTPDPALPPAEPLPEAGSSVPVDTGSPPHPPAPVPPDPVPAAGTGSSAPSLSGPSSPPASSSTPAPSSPPAAPPPGGAPTTPRP
jgi:hypothetical protein